MIQALSAKELQYPAFYRQCFREGAWCVVL